MNTRIPALAIALVATTLLTVPSASAQSGQGFWLNLYSDQYSVYYSNYWAPPGVETYVAEPLVLQPGESLRGAVYGSPNYYGYTQTTTTYTWTGNDGTVQSWNDISHYYYSYSSFGFTPSPDGGTLRIDMEQCSSGYYGRGGWSYGYGCGDNYDWYEEEECEYFAEDCCGDAFFYGGYGGCETTTTSIILTIDVVNPDPFVGAIADYETAIAEDAAAKADKDGPKEDDHAAKLTLQGAKGDVKDLVKQAKKDYHEATNATDAAQAEFGKGSAEHEAAGAAEADAKAFYEDRKAQYHDTKKGK